MATQYPAKKGAAFTVVFPILDADGDLVTAAATLDSEISKDGGTFADCTNEAAEIATSSGMYSLVLTATEMTADIVAIIVKTTTADAKTTPIVIYTSAQTLDELDAIIDSILVDTGTTLENHLTDIKGTGFVKDTDSLPQCLTATGFSTHAAADIWSVVTRALTDKAGFTISGAKTTLDALNDLTAAAVNAEVDTALADINLDHLIQITSSVSDVGPTATDFDTALAEATNDHYNNHIILFTLGALAGQARRISDYDGTAKNIIVDPAFTEAPANADTFVILGYTLNEAMRGTDSAALASVCTETRLVELAAANLPSDIDAILVDTGTTLNTHLLDIKGTGFAKDTHSLPQCLTAAGFSTHAAADVWAVGARSLTDKADFALSSAANLAIWHVLTANIVTADTIGLLLKTDIDATISSRSSHVAADIWTAASRELSTPADYKATGFSTHAAADIWAVVTRALTDKAGFSISGAKTTLDALNDVSTAEVNTQVDTALADIHLDHLIQKTGAVDDVSPTASSFITNLAEAVDDFYNGLCIIFISGDLAGQARRISDYVGATKTITVENAFTAAPANTNTFIVHSIEILSGAGPTSAQIADAVWDEEIVVGHDIADSAGEQLNDAAAGADPAAIADAVWDEAIAGHVAAGSFGVKNQLVVPSETLADYKATGFSTHAAADIWSVVTRALTDKADFALSEASRAAVADDVWDEVLTGAAHNDPTSAGRRLRQLSSITIHDGTAQAGALNSITLDADASATDGIYTGNFVVIVVGTGIGQTRRICHYVGTTKVATVTRNWVTNPDDTSEFQIIGSVEERHVVCGIATAGAAGTITLEGDASATDDIYNDCLVHISTGTGAGQTRRITDYDGTNKIASVKPNWQVNPDGTSIYHVLSHGRSDVGEIEGLDALDALADAVWDEEIVVGHNTDDTAGEQLNDAAAAAAGADPEAIADAVWNEALSDHIASESAGEKLYGIRARVPLSPWKHEDMIKVIDDLDFVRAKIRELDALKESGAALLSGLKSLQDSVSVVFKLLAPIKDQSPNFKKLEATLSKSQQDLKLLSADVKALPVSDDHQRIEVTLKDIRDSIPPPAPEFPAEVNAQLSAISTHSKQLLAQLVEFKRSQESLSKKSDSKLAELHSEVSVLSKLILAESASKLPIETLKSIAKKGGKK